MKPILRVAKLELNILFYSPIAWFLLVALSAQCGIDFTTTMQSLVTSQAFNGPHALPYATSLVFGRFFGTVASHLYLCLPLLTMGLISRETSSGTIKLLYSSPVRIREIVFGKFVAMMAYSLLLIGLVAIFTVTSVFAITSADTGLMLSGLLGLYLLVCAYAAIGLFMSCLTSYQVVAAICTLFIFAMLQFVGGLWQGIDFVRDLTYFLSIGGRAQKLEAGLITTKDILYFVTIVYMFLGFSICRLGDGRESRPLPVRVGRYAVVLISALLIGYGSSRPGFIGYYDATATKTNTLTASSQRILKELGDAPLEVTSYINLLDFYYDLGAPDKRNADVARWEPYVRFKPDIRFRYVYYYDSIPVWQLYTAGNAGLNLKQIAEKYAGQEDISLDRFKTPAYIRRMIDLRPERNKYVMQLTYKGRSTFLRLYGDQKKFPGEMETSAALERLLSARLPKIVFVQGALERSPYENRERAYSTLASDKDFRNALVNQGFDIDTVSPSSRDIPADAAALVIADPKMNLDSATVGKVRRYIDGGGDLLIAGEPGKQAVLNPLLKPLGVQLMDGMLVQPSKQLAANVLLAGMTDEAFGLSKAMKNVLSSGESRFSAGHNTPLPVSMPSAAALSYTGDGPFTIRPLLFSDTSGWIINGRVPFDSSDIGHSEGDGDMRGAFPIALCLTRPFKGREQRIVVTGDADFLSNSELRRWNVKTANFAFSTALFGWFTNDGFPIDASRPKPKDDQVNISDDEMEYMHLLFRWVLPALLGIFGIVLLLRRKRR